MDLSAILNDTVTNQQMLQPEHKIIRLKRGEKLLRKVFPDHFVIVAGSVAGFFGEPIL